MTDTYGEALSKLRAARREAGRITYQLDREDAILAYGGKCCECGSQEMPELMVIREHGTQWGQAIAGRAINSGSQKFKWLRRNHYPEGFIIICRGCRPRHKVGAPPQPEAT